MDSSSNIVQSASGAGRLQADGALALITALWGVTFVVVKDALGFSDPFSFLALRFAVGALLLSALSGREVLRPRNLRHGAQLATLLFAGFALQTVGLTETTPSRSAFITGMCVLFVPLLSLVLFRRVPRVGSLVGAALAAVGMYALTRPDAGSGVSGFSRGDLLTLGCAVAYAGHITLTERYAPKEGVMGLVAVQLWGVSLMSAACLPFVHRSVTWTPSFVGAVLVCGVLASALAISVQTWAQARTTAVRASLIYAMEPVFAACYSVALGYEVLGAREVLGGGLILTGVLASDVGTAAWDWWRARRQGTVA
ncbi:DMT family transporter [Corallococcus sp. M34]|nr:DMT family transporter [Citreicoccus inhibens]